jgi:hypothetical protein
MLIIILIYAIIYMFEDFCVSVENIPVSAASVEHAPAKTPSVWRRLYRGVGMVAATTAAGIVAGCSTAPNVVAQPLEHGTAGLSSPGASPSAHPEPYGAKFIYSGLRIFTEGSGASVRMSQHRPEINATSPHSVMELSVQSEDGRQTVEVGWTVDSAVNKGSTEPHLFVFHWVDGVPTCYNECGFVSTSDKVKPGDPVTVGEIGTYSIESKSGNWNISYNGEEVGYFPGGLWATGFGGPKIIQAFGEVATSEYETCADMGSGTKAGQPGAATISQFKAIGGETPEPAFVTTVMPDSSRYQVAFDNYGIAVQSAGVYSVGGPGSGDC